MFLPERLIALVAPHECMVCGTEGSIVCGWCLPDFADSVPSRCYSCQKATKDSRVCTACHRKSRLLHVWVTSLYAPRTKQLVHSFKFQRRQAAAEPIATMMAHTLPYLPRHTIIVHIPTASRRVRQRGYDHAALLAKHLARDLQLPYATLLERTTQTRQVGARRAERIKQMESAFRVSSDIGVKGATILLVDDLTTTGATLESAAACLRAAGAKTVSAVVFAQKQ